MTHRITKYSKAEALRMILAEDDEELSTGDESDGSEDPPGPDQLSEQEDHLSVCETTSSESSGEEVSVSTT
jgi:hypothetical protein